MHSSTWLVATHLYAQITHGWVDPQDGIGGDRCAHTGLELEILRIRTTRRRARPLREARPARSVAPVDPEERECRDA